MKLKLKKKKKKKTKKKYNHAAVTDSVRSARRFFVEIGYQERILPNRHMAFSIDAPDVKAIRNAAVQYLSNLAGYRQNATESARAHSYFSRQQF